jgi:N-acetylmuramoyl-L-alanine amidase
MASRIGLYRRFSGLKHLVWGCLLLLTAQVLSALPTRTLHGEVHVPLDAVAGALGMELRWTEAGRSVRLESRWTQLEFSKDQRTFTVNGTVVYLGRPVAAASGKLWIQERDYERTIQPILTPQVFSSPPGFRRIVIDPGHGGQDPGTMNPSLRLTEKHLALDLAKRLERIMREQGYEVLMTRSTDEFIELTDRSEQANRWNADFFVSLHFNAVTSGRVSGAETYAFTAQGDASSARSRETASDQKFYAANNQDVWNMLAAFYVQRELVSDLGTADRGVKRARFAMLRDLKCPGILIEGGFVTNDREGRNIGSAAYREKMATAIAEGLLTYQRTLQRLRSDNR